MRKSTLEKLAFIEAWLKSYKRKQWIGGIYADYIEAYTLDNSPVDSSDKPEVERLRRKIGDWYEKAARREEYLAGVVWDIQKKSRRNKAVMRRYTEVSLFIGSCELDIPLAELPGYKKFMADVDAGKY